MHDEIRSLAQEDRVNRDEHWYLVLDEDGRRRSRTELLALAAEALNRAERAERLATDPHRTPGGRRLGAAAMRKWLDEAAALEALAARSL